MRETRSSTRRRSSTTCCIRTRATSGGISQLKPCTSTLPMLRRAAADWVRMFSIFETKARTCGACDVGEAWLCRRAQREHGDHCSRRRESGEHERDGDPAAAPAAAARRTTVAAAASCAGSAGRRAGRSFVMAWKRRGQRAGEQTRGRVASVRMLRHRRRDDVVERSRQVRPHIRQRRRRIVRGAR